MIDEESDRLAAEVVAGANRAIGLLEAFKSTADRNAAVARGQAAKVRDVARFEARNEHRMAVERARQAVGERVATLAPGPLGARWDEVESLSGDVGVLDAAEYVRCGSVTSKEPASTGIEAPLVLPLLDHGNLRLAAPAERRDAASGAIQEILLRSLLGTGPGQLTLHGFDPKLSATLAMFTPLRQASEEVVRPALAGSDDLRALFERLSQDVRRISDMYGGSPTTLGEFRRSAQQPIEHYQVVTILDYPTAFDERLNQLLMTLMRTGPSCGISFVVHHATDLVPADGVVVDDVRSEAVSLDLNSYSVDIAPGFQVRAGAAPNVAVVEPALANLAKRIRQAAAPKIDFLDLQPPPNAYWTERSADRVLAVIGRTGHHPIEITLGDDIEQKHNILVTGAVGQGKSNLLMTLVHSWALRYPPSEIELYLLDFRDGVSLYPLASHGDNRDWLPHAKVLGLETDRPFGLAVLDHLVGEFERRSKIIKPHGDNVARFRRERPEATMPRIIVVIDEFQVLFEEDDEITSAALLALERLARRGRGYGIHLVLASQTLSGITALLAKQDGIFGQFPIRLALYNSASESRAVLSQNNTEAARLRYRGELIVNKDFGEIDANQRGVVAFADPDKLRAARKVLVERDADGRIPLVFNGLEPASLTDRLASLEPADGAPRASLGVTIAVEARTFDIEFEAASGRHLAILGTGKRLDGSPGSAPADTLQAAALSLAWSALPGTARFVIMNLLASSDPARGEVEKLSRLLAELGHHQRLVGSTEVVAELGALDDEVAARRGRGRSDPLFVIGFGMDRLAQARVPNFTTGTTPIDGLIAIWREGAPLGVHMLGWWANVRVFNDHVGLDAQGLIDTTVAFRVHPDAVVDLFGPFVSWASPDNRALVRDNAQVSTPETIIPFGAVDEDAFKRVAQIGRGAQS